MKYAIPIERTDNGYSAYAPDLSGCIAAADTKAEVKAMIREAIIFHIESLHEHGDQSPNRIRPLLSLRSNPSTIRLFEMAVWA